MAELVSDSYIPNTHRLRPIRQFYANGGVAGEGAVVSVYVYERKEAMGHRWSRQELLSNVDGPAYYPCKMDEVTVGKEHAHIP